MGILRDTQDELFFYINTKFNALKRLAELLEQAGDASGIIPNPANLIPLSQINLELYNQLRIKCPFLNLPVADTTAITNLKFKVQDSYYRMISKLNHHPYMRIADLNRLLNRAIYAVNYHSQPDWQRCLQFMCDSAKQASAQARAAFNEVVGTNGKINDVATIQQRNKIQQIQNVQAQLKVLAGS